MSNETTEFIKDINKVNPNSAYVTIRQAISAHLLTRKDNAEPKSKVRVQVYANRP